MGVMQEGEPNETDKVILGAWGAAILERKGNYRDPGNYRDMLDVWGIINEEFDLGVEPDMHLWSEVEVQTAQVNIYLRASAIGELALLT